MLSFVLIFFNKKKIFVSQSVGTNYIVYVQIIVHLRTLQKNMIK